MRNEWSRSVGVVVAAATLMILTQLPGTGAAADAVPAQGLNGREVAAAAPAPGSGASAVTVDDITVTTGTSDDEKPVAVPEVMPPPPTENAMPVDDTLPAEPAEEMLPPDEAPPAPERVPTGDDAHPTARQQGNNPYIDPARQEVGISNAMGSGMRAYVPPTETSSKSAQEMAGEEGAALMSVLGSSVFNMKVNVTTPPDTESAEVIRLLAERANINFVYGAGVITEKVTLNLRDVSLGVALQSILSAQDLALVREGDNVFRIVRRKDIQQSLVETRTIYIKLNWVTADSLEKTLQDFGQSGGGAKVNSVKASKEANTLIITDTPTNVALLRDIVAQLDVPEKQVMIEARMVEMLIDNGRQLGSSLVMERADSSGNSQATGRLNRSGPRTETRTKPVYDADGKITGYEDVTETIAGVPVDQLASSLLTRTAAGSINFGGVVSIFGKEFDIAATLDGLEQRRVANILANPRVITLNNQEEIGRAHV